MQEEADWDRSQGPQLLQASTPDRNGVAEYSSGSRPAAMCEAKCSPVGMETN